MWSPVEKKDCITFVNKFREFLFVTVLSFDKKTTYIFYFKRDPWLLIKRVITNREPCFGSWVMARLMNNQRDVTLVVIRLDSFLEAATSAAFSINWTDILSTSWTRFHGFISHRSFSILLQMSNFLPSRCFFLFKCLVFIWSTGVKDVKKFNMNNC